MSLHLHELESELNTEQDLNKVLRFSQQHFLAAVFQMKDTGVISDTTFEALFKAEDTDEPSSSLGGD